MKSDVFRDIVDMEKSSLAKRSRKLFTLSAFHNACADLIQDLAVGDLTKDAAMARDYWEAVADRFPAWHQVEDAHLRKTKISK